ncbi:MAG: ATP-binding protein [archaeon]
MNIRQKILVSLLGIYLVFLILVFFTFSFVLLKDYSKQDQFAMNKSINRVVDALAFQQEVIGNSVLDYAVWDDTYAFVQGKDDTYLDVGFTPDAFGRLDIDFALFTNASTVVYARLITPTGEIPAENIIDDWYGLGFSQENMTDAGYTGIIVVQDMSLLVTIHIIKTSDETASAGLLCFGKRIDSLLAEQLSARTHVPITFTNVYAQNVERTITTRDDTIIGGQTVRVVVMLLFIICSLFFIGGSYVLIDKVIIARLMNVASALQKKRELTDTGDDEIAYLVRVIKDSIVNAENIARLQHEVFEAIPDTFVLVSSDQKIVDYKSTNSCFHIEKGKHVKDCFTADLSDVLLQSMMDAQVQKKLVKTEVQCSACKKYSELCVTCVEKDMLIIIRDLTEKKQSELHLLSQTHELEASRKAAQNILEDIMEMNKHLQDLDQAKTDFLNVASHELKTPLTAISAYLEILDDYKADFSAIQLEGLGAIKRNISQLKTIINNILEVSRMESGRFELSFKDMNVKEKIQNIVDNLSILGESKGIKLLANVEEGIPLIKTDEMRFEEILNNLIGNAIKFTKQGSITVKAMRDGQFLKVSVIDTGIGIPEDKIKNLFQKFYQVDASLSRKYGGTGLGLSITKKIIQLQGGTITVESIVGKGTTFTFTLPLEGKP